MDNIDKRLKLANKILENYPLCLPVVCHYETTQIKYIVPKEKTIADILINLRKKLKLDNSQSLFLFTETQTVPCITQTIESVYKNNKNIDDNTLHFVLTIENCFG